MGRNTAPAIALGCLLLDADDLVLVTTSDHLIQNQAAYQQAVLLAKALAEQGNLVTFGIQPAYAETGFGYIEAQGNDVFLLKKSPMHQQHKAIWMRATTTGIQVCSALKPACF